VVGAWLDGEVFERWSPVTAANFVNFALRTQEKFWYQHSRDRFGLACLKLRIGFAYS